MVIFLERHKYSLDSKNFQNAFSYAIYDFLEDKKEQGVYQELKKKYGRFLGKLEEISKETMIVNEHRQNNELLTALIKNCEEGGQGEFMKDIRPYLLPMLHSGSRPVSYNNEK